MERRLTAILSGDVVAYSRLMGEDEAGTLAALKAHLKELIEPRIAAHQGRVVKLMGDGILAEFPSVVEAVQCAVQIQRDMVDRNATTPENRRLEFRIGINLGDVIVERDDIFGDGVNLAARLQELAEPGGVYVSAVVHDQTRTKLDVDFQDLGEHAVKNMTDPVRVYRVNLSGVAVKRIARAARPRRWRAPVAAAAIAVVAVIAGWEIYRNLFPPAAQESAVPPVPSIAVLPFDNLSGDPQQAYFSDGITEDLINELSRVSGLLVIARNSAFTYKGRAVKVQQVAQELGVRYVLEGSVRKAGSRIRINAQLIDAGNGFHLWAARYDRELTDVFALQDDVVQKIVAALKVELTADEAERLSRAPQADPEVYDLMLRGREQFARFTRPGNEQARAIFERVIALDPGNARAHASLAFTHAQDVIRGWRDSPEGPIGRALDASRVALALDQSLPQVHFVLANVRIAQGRLDQAVAAARRAVELDPNYADGYAAMAQALNLSGKPDAALKVMEKALRLNPRQTFMHIYITGHGHFVAERYEDAAAKFEAVLERNPQFLHGHVFLAASYGHLGRVADAQWEVEEIRTLHPDFSIERARMSAPYKHQADLDRLIDGLRKAGLPEWARA